MSTLYQTEEPRALAQYMERLFISSLCPQFGLLTVFKIKLKVSLAIALLENKNSVVLKRR